jgi:hypothetical protein
VDAEEEESYPYWDWGLPARSRSLAVPTELSRVRHILTYISVNYILFRNVTFSLAATVNVKIYWNVTPCSLVNRYKRFGG